MKGVLLACAISLLASSWFFYESNRQRRIATENLIAIINTAGLDGFANGARLRAHLASVWGGRVTNITIYPDCVQVGATDGFREWRP